MMEWENKLYQILLPGREALGVMEDWLECNIETDIRLRRAKTKGHLVIETTDTMFANRIRMWHPGCKIHIKDLKRKPAASAAKSWRVTDTTRFP